MDGFAPARATLSCSGFFVCFRRVHARLLQRAPLLITAAILGACAIVRWFQPDFLSRLENATYDLRARAAAAAHPQVASNLAFVWFDEETVRAVKRGDFGYRFGLYWPRQVYGRVVSELAQRGAGTVAFDVVFGELRHDHAVVGFVGGTTLESDDFFAREMRRAGNIILATTPDIELPDLFRTNAAALGDITTDRDSDGVLRRVKAFRDVPRWHPLLLRAQAVPEFGIDLSRARLLPGKLLLPRTGVEDIEIPLDAEGSFAVADFTAAPPPGMPARAKPFQLERRWHMGVVLAAHALGIDLERAEVDLGAGKITLRGTNETRRVLPVDRDGFFLVDWSMTPAHPALMRRPMHSLLAAEHARLLGQPVPDHGEWRDKLVIVGSAVAGGSDLTDRGATPLQEDTLLVSKHWNVASSVITGRFVRVLSREQETLLLAGLGALVALLTLRLPVRLAAGAVLVLWGAWAAAAFVLHVHGRVWLPLVLPSLALFAIHGGLVTWRVVFEQAERRRVKSVFSKIVSPNVVNELLGAEKLSLGGARREVTILFADLRGFTEFTDVAQQRAEREARDRALTGAAAEEYFAGQSRETLAAINLYLGVVADAVKRFDGTLDKYIGDCVMAFWGAPTVNPRHAVSCVRAAVAAQQAVHDLNRRRAAASGRAAGKAEPPPLLELGTGINTGIATVGLMGSDAHIVNYTVFGREVNLASRLETVSGRGRIIISAATFSHLRRHDPGLAAACRRLPDVEVKGIRGPVEIYEVPWREHD